MAASMTVTMMYIVLRRSKDTIKMSKYEKYARALRMTSQDTKFSQLEFSVEQNNTNRHRVSILKIQTLRHYRSTTIEVL